VSKKAGRSSVRIAIGVFSEFLREAAVLIAVFAPLDRVLQNKPLTVQYAVTTIGVVGVVLAIGTIRWAVPVSMTSRRVCRIASPRW
jgi:hypothetical protein